MTGERIARALGLVAPCVRHRRPIDAEHYVALGYPLAFACGVYSTPDLVVRCPSCGACIEPTGEHAHETVYLVEYPDGNRVMTAVTCASAYCIARATEFAVSS